MATTPTQTNGPAQPEALDEAVMETSSWHYWAVFRVPGHRLFLAISTVVIVTCMYAVAAVLNPSLPFGPRSVTIDHLADPSPVHDYTKAILTSMALSTNYVAIGTERGGLVLLPTHGVFPRRTLTNSAIVDVADGLDPDTFLALQKNEGLTSIDASSLFLEGHSMVDAPAHPRWPGMGSFDARSVLLAKLDTSGLLLVVQGGGVASYRMNPLGQNRLRSWESHPTTANVKVEHAVITGEGLWLSTEDGQTLFVHLATLAAVPGSALNTGRLARLDAGRDGTWASAVGAAGHIWFYSNGHWAGPWFAGPPGVNGLRDVAYIASARRSHGVLWLTTSTSVFTYEEASRTMRLFLDDVNYSQVETLPDATLIASAKGLYQQPAGPWESSSSAALDSSGASDLRVSPSGDTIAYRAKLEGGSEVFRAAVRPFTNPINVSAREGWPEPEQPGISGVVSLGPKTIFGTSHGCLLYDAAAPSYVDCSTIAATNGGVDVATGPISSIEGDNDTVLAVAGGIPLVYRMSDSRWQRLDPQGHSQFQQLTPVGNSIYGLGVQGSLFRMNTGGPVEMLSGRAPSLRDRNDFTGDAIGDANNWRLALVNDNHLVYYSSSNGAIEDRILPSSQVHQVRIHDLGPLVLLYDGSIIGRDGLTIFGRGRLPFAPQESTVVAQGADGTVLVGGPAGRVSRYSWAGGDWDSVEPVPSGLPISRLQEDDGDLWAKTGSEVLRLRANQWIVQDGYSAWLVEQPGTRTWLAGRAGVALETVADGRTSTTFFSSGGGIRQFLAEAKYSWQIDADRVALFGSSLIGVFSRRTDRWETVEGGASDASVFLPFNGHLIVKDGPIVSRYSLDLQNSVLLRASGSLSIHLAGASLQALVHNGGSLSLYVWNDASMDDSKTSTLVDERILDGALAADGRVWALRQGELIELQRSGDQLVVKGRRMAVPPTYTTLDSLIAADQRFAFLAPQHSAPARAALQYGADWLDWSVTPSGGAVEWRGRPDLPVWCAASNRLAVQCVHEITRDGDALVLATEAGVVRRSLNSFELKGAEIGRGTGTFPDHSGAAAGPLSFSIGQAGLIVFGPGGRQSWEQNADGWRFHDDNIDWIGRDSHAGLVLQSSGGSWAWLPNEGRRTAAVAQSETQLSLDTPAIRVRYRGGRIILEAFDHESPFADGRLFMDSVSSIHGHAGSLYTLIAGRCVIRRDGSNPERITGAWDLPARISGTLEKGERGVRFVSGSGVWELVVEGSGASWSSSGSDLTEAVTGPIAWRHVAGHPGIDPYVGTTLLGKWWSGDRFTWDRVLSAGTLDKGVVVLVTPLGPMLRQVASSDSVPKVLWLQSGLTRCTPAREGDRIVGMLLGDRLLLDAAPDGTPRLRSAPPGLDLAPRLVLDWVTDASGVREIAFRETWRERGTGASLESRLLSLPTSRLISKGRFSFDSVATAGHFSSDLWVAASAECTTGSCLGALYQLTGSTLHLRDVVSLPEPVDSIRSSSKGTLFASGVQNHFELHSEDGALRFDRADDTSDAFYQGDSVSLQLPALRWEAHPRYVTRESAFSVTPVDFPLMKSTQEGAAFSFDILTSVAAFPAQRKLVLASDAGIFFCAPPANQLDLSTDGGCRLSLGSGSVFLNDVSRIRVAQGRLWAAYGDGRLAVSDGGEWNEIQGPAPWQVIETISGKVSLEPDGIDIAGRVYKESNNAWGIGVRPLDDISEMVYDPKSRFAWLCSRSQGVFKLRLNHFADKIDKR